MSGTDTDEADALPLPLPMSTVSSPILIGPPQTTLPTELWLDILKILSRNDLRVIAGVCRALYDIVFSMRRTAVFVVDDTSTEQMFHASTWLLDRATEVHWSFINSPGWKGFPRVFSDRGASRTDSFRIMLPLLYGCRNLSSLVLTGIVVGGKHQQTIYSLPQLRKITLRSAFFQSTSLEIPKHNVNHLIYSNVPSGNALSHILRQTSSTLVTLRVTDGLIEAFSRDTPRCPHLTEFTHLNPTRAVNGEVMTFLQRHPNIRVVQLHPGYTNQDLGPSFLTKVTKVTASAKLGRVFFARPELREFYQYPNDDIGRIGDLRSWIEQAQRSRSRPPRLEQLRIAIWYHRNDPEALPVISHFFGSTLCKLHIWIDTYSWGSTHPHPSSYSHSGLPMLMASSVHPRSKATAKFARLRSIRVSFRMLEGVEFPEAICRELLRDSILPLCPVLEEASFTAMSSYKTIEQEPEYGMELRIRKNGRGWDLPFQG